MKKLAHILLIGLALLAAITLRAHVGPTAAA